VKKFRSVEIAQKSYPRKVFPSYETGCFRDSIIASILICPLFTRCINATAPEVK